MLQQRARLLTVKNSRKKRSLSGIKTQWMSYVLFTGLFAYTYKKQEMKSKDYEIHLENDYIYEIKALRYVFVCFLVL